MDPPIFRFNSRSAVLLCCIVAAIASSGLLMTNCSQSSDYSDVPEHAFTTTVDWYKPVPENLRSALSKPSVLVPHELITGVRASLRAEATTLLGRADFVQITIEQAHRLSSLADPDSILQSLIQGRKEKIRFFEDHPVTGFTGEELKRQLAMRKNILANLHMEIAQFKQWQHGLKAYLIKAVTLSTGQGFWGSYLGSDVLIGQTTLSSHLLPMKKMPVVAYLPYLPRKIYTGVSVLQ